MSIVAGAVLAAVLLSPGLPEIALNTSLANAVVGVTDTAVLPWLVLLGIAVVLIVSSRSGISYRRRRVEVGTFTVALLIFLAGSAAINGYIVKPFFGIPRPNIEQLAESGALGADFTDAESFYAIGDKAARREVLENELATLTTPQLSDRVRAHWAYETGYSFPSGHSTIAMTLAAMATAAGLAWLDGWRRILAVVVFPVWAVTVAYSRVLLDVHTGVDVIAGTMAGFGWGLIAFGTVQWGVARWTPIAGGGEGAEG